MLRSLFFPKGMAMVKLGSAPMHQRLLVPNRQQQHWTS